MSSLFIPSSSPSFFFPLSYILYIYTHSVLHSIGSNPGNGSSSLSIIPITRQTVCSLFRRERSLVLLLRRISPEILPFPRSPRGHIHVTISRIRFDSGRQPQRTTLKTRSSSPPPRFPPVENRSESSVFRLDFDLSRLDEIDRSLDRSKLGGRGRKGGGCVMSRVSDRHPWTRGENRFSIALERTTTTTRRRRRRRPNRGLQRRRRR